MYCVEHKCIKISVLIVFSLLMLSIPVLASGEITATRQISKTTVNPGENFTVVIDLSTAEELVTIGLQEVLPSGWTITENNSGLFTYSPSQNEWVWSNIMSNVPSGTSATVIYDVTVPASALPGDYIISGKTLGKQTPDNGGTSIVYDTLGDDLISISSSGDAISGVRTLSQTSVNPGDIFSVLIELTTAEELVTLGVQETVPEGWVIAENNSGLFTYSPSQNEWVWSNIMSNVPSGTTATIIYDVTVPENICFGEYSISGKTVGKLLPSSGGASIEFAIEGQDQVLVNNVPPVFDAIDDLEVDENEYLSFNVAASDQECDTLTYSAVGLEALPGANFNATTLTFEWTPSYSQDGTYMVMFKVSDGELENSTIVNIKVNNIDRPLELDSIGNKVVNENELLSIMISATDPDGDTVTYSANGLPAGAIFDDVSGEFSWIPNYNDAGNYNVEFIATANGVEDSETITISVENIDRAPELDPIGNKVVNENELLSFIISATDPDGDTVAYSSNGLPAGSTLDDVSGEFSWIPNYNDAGNYNVEFIATAFGVEDSETITITVENIDRAPELNPIGNKVANENELLSFTILATDSDGDTVTYSAKGLPAGATLDDVSGEFTWTPEFGLAGNYAVEFIATANGVEDSETITISVGDVDRAPEIDPIGNKFVNENELLSFTILATDLDGDAVTYTANGLPTGATLDDVSGEFSWTPGYNDSGNYDVEFIVVANSLNDSETITITVENVDRAPAMDTIGDKTVNENESLIFTISAIDPDPEDVLVYSTNASFGELVGNEFSWTPGFDDVGEYIVEFSVTDGTLTDSQKINIIVQVTPTMLLEISDGLEVITPNTEVTYEISYDNRMSMDLHGAVITNGLPDGVTFVSASDNGVFDENASAITWYLGDVPKDASGVITVTVMVNDNCTGEIICCAMFDCEETSTFLATDETNVISQVPSISIEKLTNGHDSDTPVSVYIPVGETVTWKYIVTNTGGVPLVNIEIVDDKEGLVGTKDVLNPGETVEYLLYGTAEYGLYTNEAQLTAEYNGLIVSDIDPSSYYGYIPSDDNNPIHEVPTAHPLVTASVLGFVLMLYMRRK
ncbi:putative Ig domain-containing protein [Methanolobus mangrovi]|uniref:Ig domain-containing protein n=1 Tax=Methanolobus mangrovi TaxID=3072977 RepID=A0AA51UGY0_9EURY|nr:putative Ig domain-containing protein [Methanolobus mangrovi]WMW23067.1 putative Ig domain-containing protein [Methanolobus mangrovi]